MAQLKLLAEVAVLNDVPERGLARGQGGTVAEALSPEVVEVEFSDDEGRTYAMAALPVEQLVLLHHRPLGQAA